MLFMGSLLGVLGALKKSVGGERAVGSVVYGSDLQRLLAFDDWFDHKAGAVQHPVIRRSCWCSRFKGLVIVVGIGVCTQSDVVRHRWLEVEVKKGSPRGPRGSSEARGLGQLPEE